MPDLLSEFYGPNAGYVYDLYERYRQDPDSVDPAARELFARWTPPATPTLNGGGTAIANGAAPTAPAVDVLRIVGAAALADAIREYGHLGAHIDPLGKEPPGDPELELSSHGVTEADLAALPASVVRGPVAASAPNALEAIKLLRQRYSGPIGYDFDHVQVAEERAWLAEAAETDRFRTPLSPAEQRAVLERLTQVETFERFIHRTFLGQKRFSIEGLDVLVPMLDLIIRAAGEVGTREVVMGMAHRGRLNVLTHILGKPYTAILSEFRHPALREGGAQSVGGNATAGWTGDVKYHLGAKGSYRRERREEDASDSSLIPQASYLTMRLTLMPNPSHLEFVNPVIEGAARATQDRRNKPGPPEQNPDAALPILIHGDAAFPGEGVVAETLNLSRLKGYGTGGTINIIANNQLGFTTRPESARSTLYASDLAKGFEIPVVHVNADDVEACLAMACMAYAYRQRFHKDFLIDLVGYRRWGHNEGDEPAFTQPKMYAIISKHPTVREIWARQLEQRGVIPPGEAEALSKASQQTLQAAHKQAENVPPPGPPDRLRPEASAPVETGVPAETLIAFNEALLQRPEGFTPNPKLERQMQRRKTSLTDGEIDWGHAEVLAFASILAEGIPIRFSGQDTERGTFSQRHLVLHDPETDQSYTPLQALPQARASFAVYNSPLSEIGALGFEYGYSVQADPKGAPALVLWEAQFGDFANAGQVIIDQFVTAAWAKWGQTPGLVLLLPHGYEGQGPEHSSGRLERYLQLAAGDNFRVANCTNAAQYYHLLRRQAASLARDPRPLVVMTPKSLLRHPLAACKLEALTKGRFQPLLVEELPRSQADAVTRLILCSGKVYVDLMESKQRETNRSVTIARVEELYPFPAKELQTALRRFSRLRELVWLQEEPQNMGAWTYMEPRLRALVGDNLELRYIGRPERASPAEGTLELHQAEQTRIVEEAFRPKRVVPTRGARRAEAG